MHPRPAAEQRAGELGDGRQQANATGRDVTPKHEPIEEAVGVGLLFEDEGMGEPKGEVAEAVPGDEERAQSHQEPEKAANAQGTKLESGQEARGGTNHAATLT